MTDNFKNIKPEQITDNTFKLIGTDWTLITAGTKEKFNTMTASWGGLGILWGKKVAFCVIRPQRYTYEFIENSNTFTMSFFTEDYRAALNLCGKKSGRDIEKAAEAGITPVELEQGGISFSEARLVLECRKLYYHDIDPEHFIDTDLDKNYPNKDYHRMYVGEIVNCYIK
jgi:Conserved protein/domain typically associated with flavoprotein oxygenases, DIM6/NTAB family